MKNFFVYLAIFVVLIFCIICFTDFGTTEITVLQFNQEISSACENASGMIESEEFGEGYYVFNDTEVLKQVKTAVRGEADTKIEVLDKSGHRTYTEDADGNFQKTGTEICSFPYSFTNYKGDAVSLNNPSIVVTSTLTGKFYKVFKEEQSYTKQVIYEAVGYADL